MAMKKTATVGLTNDDALRGTLRNGKAVYFDPPASTEVKKLGEVGQTIKVLTTVCENPRVTERQRTPYAALGADSIHGLAEEGAPAAEQATNGNGLRISSELVEVLAELMADVKQLAEVTPDEEATIREDVRRLDWDIFDAADREAAYALVAKVSEALVAQKKSVGISTLVGALRDKVADLRETIEATLLCSPAPVITKAGITFLEPGVHQITAIG